MSARQNSMFPKRATNRCTIDPVCGMHIDPGRAADNAQHKADLLLLRPALR
jgi:hypothetical protein